MIEYEKFQMSLARLEEQHANYRNLDTSLPVLNQEGIAESVIQRFETCYDCLWKVLKRYLIEELGIADPPNSPKPIFRLAYENDLFSTPLEQWWLYVDARIGTSHDYDGTKAQDCLEIIPDFIDDAIGLYQTMSGEAWGWTGVIDITAKQRQTVLALLARHLPNTTVWVYGSRAKWTSRPQSDLDMVVFATPEQASRVSDLEEAFEESNLPFRVDLFVWDAVPDQFRKKIEREHVVLLAVEEPDIVDQFDVVRLGDVASVRSGYAFKSSDWVDTGIPVVKIQNVKSGSLIMDGCSFVSPQVASDAGEFELQHNDILIAMTGYIGDIAMVRHRDLPAVLNQRVGRFSIRDPNRIDNRFLFYSLRYKGVRKKIENLGYGSAQPNVSPSLVHSVDIPLPPLSEQLAIAHILGTLDDKIELNRRMNETLEAMARALFKSWFVDFDPVRAKMEGRHTGLPQEIAELFPERLVNSEMGKIPEGWEVFRLDQLANHHTKTTSPSRFSGLEYEHFSIPAYDAGQRPAIELGAAIRSNKTVVLKDAVLLSKLNPRIARVWVPADSTARPQICSTEFLVFTPRSPANRNLLFTLFGDQRFRALLRSLVTGTSNSHQRVPPKALKAREVLTGSPRAFTTFGEVIGGTLARILKNRSEAATLAALRDTLLPKLISGEIRVGDAEMALESVT